MVNRTEPNIMVRTMVKVSWSNKVSSMVKIMVNGMVKLSYGQMGCPGCTIHIRLPICATARWHLPAARHHRHPASHTPTPNHHRHRTRTAMIPKPELNLSKEFSIRR